jgi:hemolysin activation/secretion protein
MPIENFKGGIVERERTKLLEGLVEKMKAGASKPKERSSKSKNIILQKIEFSQVEILPQSFFEDIKKKYENTQVGIEDIYAIVDSINNEYMLKGYIACHAFLLEQDITSGNLFISIVEGLVSEVKISGHKTTSENYIKRYLHFENISNFNANTANTEILKFNAENDAKARIALSPGRVFGTSIVDIVLDEPNRYSMSASIDNAGQKETGLTRYGGYVVVRSITRYRDIFNIGGVFSEASNAVFTSYEIPEPFLGTRIGIGFDYSDNEIISGGLEALNVNGRYYNVSLYSKKPFFIRDTTVTNFTLTVNTKKGESFISSFKTQDTKTDAVSLSADNTLLFSWGYLFNSLSYYQGFRLIEGDTVFEKASYYGETLINIYKTIAANIKARGQYGADIVPSSEQFSIGGINTIRGYREGMLSGRDAISANIEILYDLPLRKFKFAAFRLYAFFDFGIVYPDKNANLPDDYDNKLYSAGGGLKLNILKHIDANIVYAAPLLEHKYYESNKYSILFMIQGKI